MSTLYILIGIPNSGKSTWTASMVEQCKKDGKTCSVHSTDDFFMVEGKYVFDASKLGKYHTANVLAANHAFFIGMDVVIIDNTNLKPRDYKPYVDYAEVKGYDVVIKKFPIDIATALERNKKRFVKTGKNIPDDVIKRMHADFTRLHT